MAVPWSEINVFILGQDRFANTEGRVIDSALDDELAELVLDRFESSAGVRPTFIRLNLVAQ